MPRHHQIIAVVIKQYGTGLYRTCVSLGTGNMTYLGTYRDERSASDKIGEFWKAWDEGQIRQPEDLASLITEQSSDQQRTSALVSPITPLAA
ncbi:MAG: hypothetical protein ACKOB4_15700 [Acidobacteriota bacterium]